MKNSIIVNITLLILLCTAEFSVNAQTDRVPYSVFKYPYINYDTCFLEHFGNDINIEKFYNKLDNLCLTGDGQISIIQLAGSHMQAGIWSWELRSKFETLCPGMEGAPGLVFPFSIAATNHPFYYKSKYTGNWEISKITDLKPEQTLGLMGISASTTDSIAEISISFNPVAKIQNHKFDKISIFRNVEDSSYLLTIKPDDIIDTSYIDLKTGSTVFYLKREIDSVNLCIARKDSATNGFIFYGAYLQNSKPGINYSGIGINGASTHSYLKAELFKTHLYAVMPDLVILSIGVNDASGKNFSQDNYVSNYKKIINMILAVNPDCAIILTTNNDFYQYRGGENEHYDKVYEGMKVIATTYGASVWNMFKVMGGRKSINLWKNDNLANKDRIHFTREGYKIIAGLLFDAILKDYEKHLQTLPESRLISD